MFHVPAGVVIPEELEVILRNNEPLARYLIDREIEVLVSLYGLTDGIPKTLKEVGLTLGVSSSQIQAIRNKALAGLRYFKKDDPMLDKQDRQAIEMLHLDELSIGDTVNPDNVIFTVVGLDLDHKVITLARNNRIQKVRPRAFLPRRFHY